MQRVRDISVDFSISSELVAERRRERGCVREREKESVRERERERERERGEREKEGQREF